MNIGVLSRVGEQRNETFRGWHEMQRRMQPQWKLMALKEVARLKK